MALSKAPLSSPICQDQLLVPAVFPYCPLERGGSQLERGARGYAPSPLCGETHRGLERLGAGAGGRARGNTPEGGVDFFFFLSPPCTQVGLVFLRGLFSSGTFAGRIYWRYTIPEGGKGPSVRMLPLQLPDTFSQKTQIARINTISSMEDKMPGQCYHFNLQNSMLM